MNDQPTVSEVESEYLAREAQQQRMQLLLERLDNEPFSVILLSEEERQDLKDALIIAGEL
jgi:hypothetical protein